MVELQRVLLGLGFGYFLLKSCYKESAGKQMLAHFQAYTYCVYLFFHGKNMRDHYTMLTRPGLFYHTYCIILSVCKNKLNTIKAE